jgi:hypothetical protein
MIRNNRNDEINAMINQYLSDGGEILNIREGTVSEQNRAQRLQYHREKAIEGDERSQSIIDREAKKEASLIFSKEERMRA